MATGRGFGLELIFLTIGFLGLICSMMVFFASYTEKKFYQLLSRIYEVWDQEKKEMSIGVKEYKKRMEDVESMLPQTDTLRKLMNATSAAIILGLAVYSYGLLATFKGWKPVNTLLKIFIASAFLFIFSGFSSFYVNRKLLDSIKKLSVYLRSIYES